MGGNKGPQELIRKARCVQLDVLGQGNQAVILLMPAPEGQEYRNIDYFASHINPSILSLKYSKIPSYVCLNVQNLEALEKQIPNLETEDISQLIRRATWSRVDADGKRKGFFHKKEDAIACLEAMRWMTTLFELVDYLPFKSSLLKRQFNSKDDEVPKLFMVAFPDKNYAHLFREADWESYGKKITPLDKISSIMDEASWESDNLESARKRSAHKIGVPSPMSKNETSITARFKKKVDIEELSLTLKLLTGEDIVFDTDKNTMTFTEANRRSLAKYLPDQAQLPKAITQLHLFQ